MCVTRAKIFCYESMICLQIIPFTCWKRPALCFGAFPFDSHFEIHLQNGSALCIWRIDCNQYAVSDFGMVLGVPVT